jgi:hypothetical protein
MFLVAGMTGLASWAYRVPSGPNPAVLAGDGGGEPECPSGGEWGYDQIGSNSFARAADTFNYSTAPATTAGLITHCWYYHASQTDGATVGIYELDGTLLSDLNVGDSGSGVWEGGQMDESVCMESGTPYVVGVVSDNSFVLHHELTEVAGVGNYRAQLDMTYGTDLGNTTFTGLNFEAEGFFSIYCNDTGTPPS